MNDTINNKYLSNSKTFKENIINENIALMKNIINVGPERLK